MPTNFKVFPDKLEQAVVELALETSLFEGSVKPFVNSIAVGLCSSLYIRDLVRELPDDELLSLLDEATIWPDDVAAYRE